MTSLAAAAAGLSTPASAQVTAVVPAVATVQTRTSLSVSADVLELEVPVAPAAAAASVEFSAGVRTASGAEVVLSVEPVGGLQGPGGAADVESTIAFDGQGAGTVPGILDSAGPSTAARWTGSGLRTGRLVFTIRAAAPGVYRLPLRFVVSAP